MTKAKQKNKRETKAKQENGPFPQFEFHERSE